MIFTHIVVGGGSSGAVLAARISENPDFNVLLLEAGPDYGDHPPAAISDARFVPMRGHSTSFDLRHDWNLNVSMTDGSVMSVPQARILGGGSGINGGISIRSTPNDSKEWVDLGNTEWSFPNVVRSYQDMEDDPAGCGRRGTFPISRAHQFDLGKIQKAFWSAVSDCGYSSVHDFNLPNANGVGPLPMSRIGSLRISTAKAYIDPIRNSRKNLTIRANTSVDKIIIVNKKATGLRLANGQTIRCNEVVLAGGAICTPAILQRSGVGPRDLLNSLGVPCAVDLPVGKNFCDHPSIPLVAKPRSGAWDDEDFSLQCGLRTSSSYQPYSLDHQLTCFSFLYATSPVGSMNQRSLAGKTSGAVAGVGCMMNKPKSTGDLKISNRDPYSLPIVNPCYLAEEVDRSSARELVRLGWKVLTSPEMQTVLELPEYLSQKTINSDKELDEYIRTTITSAYHFSGSCRMASRQHGGVVDQSGKIYGLDGIRVGDASIIPTAPAANTMLATIMFAERIGVSTRDGIHIDVSRTEARL